MKHLEKHLSKFLALVAVLFLFGNEATANSKVSDDFQSSKQVVSIFQQDTQEKPFHINEISIGEVVQTISQNENFGFGQVGVFYSRQEFPQINDFSTFHCSFSLKDKRELIFQYLFPFHFFW